MAAFEPIPLGTPIPPLPHAVSCSLPSMRDVRGYEEKDPAVTGKMTSGYPRFVVHPFAKRLTEHLASALGLSGRRLWLTSSARMAEELAAHLGDAAAIDAGGLPAVSHPDSPELAGRAKLFLQHVGGFLSSRQAEDKLASLGLVPAPGREELFPGNAAAELARHLRPALPGASEGDIFFANSGMNAVYAAFRAVAELQAARGRTVWIQLGWLYLDTIEILKKLTPSAADYVRLSNVFDLAALRRLLEERGGDIAGIVTEIPTNPLIQTPDVPALSELCRKHEVRLILDPSVSSAFSVNILPFTDVLVSSLTKYTASEGDVIAGLVAVNPAGPDAGPLRSLIAAALEPVYPRDLSRLAAEAAETESVLSRIQATTPQVAEFLARHPNVKEVFWALEPASAANYRQIARTRESTGGMISFSLKGPLQPFYDRLQLPKGPSFGMKTTLICPFMYLAHYDLVSTTAGRAELLANGIDPELLRLCVGVEPASDIMGALAAALG